MSLSRGLILPAVVAAFLPLAIPQPQPSPRAVLDGYCVGCHNAKTRSGGVDLTSLKPERAPEQSDVWEKVVRKLRSRTMPPIGLPRPSEAEYDGVAGALEGALDRAYAAKPNPGRTDTFRRLNRTEYHNAIRDLLALDVDVSAMLPADDSSLGFDNVTVGELSPTLLERYLTAAQKIGRLAVGVPVRAPSGDTVVMPADLTQEEHFDELPFGTRGGTAIEHQFPLDATYEFQLRLARDRNEHVEGLTGTHQMELTIDGERVGLFTVQPPPRGEDHSKVDAGLVARVTVKAGMHEVGAAFLKKPTALLETERQPYIAHFNMDRHPRIQPALYSITILGPFDASGPGESPSRARIFGCYPKQASEQDACAEKILLSIARRAWRRPVTTADIRVPMKFYREAKTTFDDGIELGLRSILVSPEFIFRVEQDPANASTGSAYRISDLELASRLSFFLWSSIPDDELLNAAAAGTLHTRAVLEKQARRMLADPRAEALTTNFAEQWLYLRNLATANPDARIFPDFDDNLRQAFRRETEMFFSSVVHEDRNVLDLLRANYTFVNERLARHYGIPNVYGSRFRRVEFPEGSPRGGLLGQGSVLTVTSYATRTSPVIRGKWILTNILGAPPPAPPPNVPVLKETPDTAGKVPTMRERMAEHRANPACAGCHKMMDPVGFAMENFDAVGRLRTAEKGSASELAPVDATGGLPDGSTFEGVAGLKKALLSRPELFVSTTTEKLMTYALGRGVETFDAPAVRQVVHAARENDYRFSSLVVGIVESSPFQMRRSQ